MEFKEGKAKDFNPTAGYVKNNETLKTRSLSLAKLPGNGTKGTEKIDGQ